MEKSKNELIEKRRKRLRRKKLIVFLVLLAVILIIVSIKMPYFKIQTINVYNNSTLNSNEIISESKIKKGANIFYLNTKSIESNILDNPYVSNVKISRKLPNTINIYVEERKAAFYVEKDKKYVIIDKNGICLEIVSDIKNLNLIQLIGVDASKAKVGEVIAVDDKRKLSTISTLTDIISANNSICKNIKSIDIQDEVNINAYYNNMEIKLGSSDDLLKKLNRAINIINGENLSAQKGYVDVSFNGNPVYSIQK